MAGALPPSPACLHNQKRSTWASRVAACSRQLTAAQPGHRSLTARYRSAQPARSQSPIPIQTCSISAPDQTECAATSPLAAACTSRLTQARRGNLLVYITPDRSARCAFIRLIRTSFGLQPVATLLSRTKNAVFSKLLTAARRGAKCCLSLTLWARWTSSCNRALRTLSTRGCRISNANHGRSSAARVKVVSTRAPMVANTSRRSRTVFPTS